MLSSPIIPLSEAESMKKYTGGGELYELHYQKIENSNYILRGQRVIYDRYNSSIVPTGFIERYGKIKSISTDEAKKRIGNFLDTYNNSSTFPSAQVTLTHYTDETSLPEPVSVESARFGYPNFQKAHELDPVNGLQTSLEKFETLISNFIVQFLTRPQPSNNLNVIPLNFPNAFIEKLSEDDKRHVKQEILRRTAEQLKKHNVPASKILFIGQQNDHAKLLNNSNGITILPAVDSSALASELKKKGYNMINPILADSLFYFIGNGYSEKRAFNGKEENDTRKNPELMLFDDFNRYSIVKEYFPEKLNSESTRKKLGIDDIHQQMQRQSQKAFLERVILRIFPSNEEELNEILGDIKNSKKAIREDLHGKFIEVVLDKANPMKDRAPNYQLRIKAGCREKLIEKLKDKFHIEHAGKISNDPLRKRYYCDLKRAGVSKDGTTLFIQPSSVFQTEAQPLSVDEVSKLKHAALVSRASNNPVTPDPPPMTWGEDNPSTKKVKKSEVVQNNNDPSIEESKLPSEASLNQLHLSANKEKRPPSFSLNTNSLHEPDLPQNQMGVTSDYIRNIAPKVTEDNQLLENVIDNVKNLLGNKIDNVEAKITLLLRTLKNYSQSHREEIEQAKHKVGYKAWKNKDDFKDELQKQGKKIFNKSEFPINDELLKELKKISIALQRASENNFNTPGRSYHHWETKEKATNFTRSFRLAQLLKEESSDIGTGPQVK